MMNVKEIESILPHRFPFLLVDRIIEMVPGEKAVGVKNATINEHFFCGHFPGNPIMPGVLIVEALAQTAGVLAFKSGMQGKAVYFMSIEKVKFRKPVIPGDQVRLEVKVLQQRGKVWKFAGQAVVDGKVASEAEFTAMVSDGEI
ncbi:MAG: 3-hydroxyacyl-ACP dehydratase FabZ [Nitrospiraceae bacterium]|nr:3-hydroxyacyl-ACP dehydratase FabZ [Nitrospiraceae bacterium]